MRIHFRSFLFLLLTVITASHAFGQATVYLFTNDDSSYWGNGLNWYAYHPDTGTQTNGSVPTSSDTVTVAAVNANFVSGTVESPNVYRYTGTFEMINSRLTTTPIGGWETHNATLALAGTTTIRGLTVGGGLEVRNEGAMTIDYDGSGNGNLGSSDKFRMRNAAEATVDIITTEGSARIISMGYYNGYYTNEGVTRINTLAGASVTFKNSYNYGGSVNNSGSFEKSGVGDLIIDYYTQASTGGTFVEAGELRAWGASLDGIIDVTAGATFRLSGGAVFRDGLEGRGAGSYLVDAGTIRPEGNSSFNRLTLAGATITNEDDAGTLTVGDLNISANSIIGSNYALSSVVATGSASTITGSIKLAGNYTTQLPALINEGTMTWSGGSISANNRMYVTNASSGTFIASADTGTTRTMSGGYYGGWFQNDGTVQKNGDGTIAIDAYYRDSGNTQVDGGIISFGAGGASSGSFTLGDGGTARVSNGTFKLQEGFTATGTGLFDVKGGVLAPTGTNSISHLSVTGGKVYNQSDTGTLTVGNIHLSAGTIGANETLTTTIATGSTSTITGDIKFEGNFTTQLPAFTNAGTLTWTAGSISASNRMYAANSATGTFIAHADTDTTRIMSGGNYGGWFRNDGTVQKTGAGTIAINAHYRGAGNTQVDDGILSFGAGGNTSGGFTIANDSIARLSNGTLVLQDGVTVTGAGLFDVKNGILSPTGTNAISNLAVTGGKVANETNAGTLTVGNIHLSAGTIGANETLTTTTATGSTSTITGDIKFEGNYTTQLPALSNEGTITWTGGSISASNRMYFANAVSGTFIAHAETGTTRTVTGGYYSGWFKNDGTFQKTGAGTIAINTHYRGSGSTQVEAGILNLGAGGTLSGTATISDGAILRHSGSTLTLQDGFTATGAGRFENTSSDLAIEGTTSIAQLAVSGGTVGINNSAPATLNVGDLHLSGGNIGTNSNQGTISASGAHSTITGNITIYGSGLNETHSLINTGTMTWSNGNINGGTYMKLNNAVGGTFTADAGTGTTRTMSGGSYTGRFINDGLVTKTGAGTVAFNTHYRGTGTTQIEDGILNLGAGGTLSGTATIADGAILRHSGNTLTLQDGFTATGAGRFENTSSDLVIEGTTSIAQLAVSGGTVGFNNSAPATLNVGDLHLSGGNVGTNSNQATVIASGANSTITGNITLNGSGLNNAMTLTNTGTLTWSGGNINGGTYLKLQNATDGTFIADAGEGITRTLNGGSYGGSFLNEGSFQKTGDGTITIASNLNNQGDISITGGRLQITGTLTTSADSTLALSQGASFKANSDLNLASLTGSGSIENSVTVTNTLSPGSSPGLLSITGNLTLTSSATSLFEIEGLTAGTGYDQVTSTGSIILDGMLSLTVSPLFAASLSEAASFDLLMGSSLTGAFLNATDGIRLTELNGLGSFLVSYTGTGLQLSSWESSTSAVPEPATTVALLGLAALITAMFRRRRA